jgi:hypothetical protein
MRTAFLLMTAALVAISPHSSADVTEVFDQLKALAGDWDAELPGFGELTSSVQLVSNGKAIEETIGTDDDNEISVYTVSGEKVLMTHYCALTPDGHQVHLSTQKRGAGPNHLEFDLVSATNLHSMAAPHMRHLSITIIDRDHYAEQWTKSENGKDTILELQFARRIDTPETTHE